MPAISTAYERTSLIVTTNLPFLRWLVAHPTFRAGEATTAFLTEQPPLSAPPASTPPRVWRGPFRLNLASPAPQPAPEVDAARGEHTQAELSGSVTASMPGTVVKVDVEVGSIVVAGQPVIVLEAMKMETPLLAPYEGTVVAVHAVAGDRVTTGAVLVEIEAG